jgi:hypothetical protein
MQHYYENPFTILFLDQLINDNILHLSHSIQCYYGNPQGN